ncbi:hypothetical protein OG871_26465 [Kitasatospora sp. NBC_00374]|uniref:DUF7848 domain-containing protein n=1 Tax=Kitasatospora sp. NBC_00374 TaxID=2975964 RepID=UPI0030E127FA
MSPACRSVAVHGFGCLGELADGTPCGAESGMRETEAAAVRWVLVHLREHPHGRGFVHRCRRWWLPADPGPG